MSEKVGAVLSYEVDWGLGGVHTITSNTGFPYEEALKNLDFYIDWYSRHGAKNIRILAPGSPTEECPGCAKEN